MSEYEVICGLEIHVQQNTKTKMFCRCNNDSENARPNTNVCPVCMGFPGQLPKANKKAIEKSIAAGLMLGSQIPERSMFDRKNYFYPDSPKGYQITQNFHPIAIGGNVEIEIKEGKKNIRIHHMHLEEDAGKLTHTAQGSLIDYNRTGTPLMELVTEPDINSVEEAVAFAKEVQRIMRYSGASNADMEKGMMRFDVNVSLRPFGQKEFGNKVEIKNLNSFSSMEKAFHYEIKRQTKALKAGETIHQETRGWDDVKQKTTSQRSKETAFDYRYHPEPDLPPVVHKQDLVDKIKATLPELPSIKRQRYVDYGIGYDESVLLSNTLEMAQFFEEASSISDDPKKSAAFITTNLLKHLNENHIDIKDSIVTAKHIGELVNLINNETISNNTAKNEVMSFMLETGDMPSKIVEEKGLKQVVDTNLIDTLCKKAIESNQKAVDQYKGGHKKAIGALVGFCMKEGKGQVNPKHISEHLEKLLSE